jgi:hypothetical protein
MVLMLIAVAACSDSGGSTAANPSTRTEDTTAAAELLATDAPTTDPRPIQDDSEEALVYVVMGNSLLFSTPAVMYAYRDILEEDLGVEVDMRDHTVGGQFTQDFLEQLRTNDRLRGDLAEADVILSLIPNEEWKEPCYTIMAEDGRDPAVCGGDDGLHCLRSVAASYNAMVEEIFVELTVLADPAEMAIRVMDYYVFTAGEDDAAAVETLAPLWQESQEYVEVAADRYGIPVAQVYDEFMSPDGTGIPEQKGLVSDDGVHVTAAGSELIAQIIRELGYDPASGEATDVVAVTGQYPAPDEYIEGEQWGEPIPGAGYERMRGTVIRHADNGLSDDRVNGGFEALMDIDVYVEGDRTTGLITMTRVKIINDGGTWEGTGVGTTSWTTSQPSHRHHIHFTLLGTGDYEGLQFRYHVEGIDLPWTVTGTIEPIGG